LIEKYKATEQAASFSEVLEQIKEADGINEADTYSVQLKNIIEKYISNPELSLVLIADEIGLSTGYLSGLFKKLFGLSFQDYVLKHLGDNARLL
jgi:two-component system response regulator YesN